MVSSSPHTSGIQISVAEKWRNWRGESHNPLLKRLHKVAPNYTPETAALDGCQAQNRQAAAPPVPFPLPPHSCTVLRGSRNQFHPAKSTSSCTTSILKESSMEHLCSYGGMRCRIETCPIFVPRTSARSSGPPCRRNFIVSEIEILCQVSSPLKVVTNPLHYCTATREICWKIPACVQRAHKWET